MWRKVIHLQSLDLVYLLGTGQTETSQVEETGVQPIKVQVPELWPKKGDNPRPLPATETKC